jgi:glutathione S-transferase
MIILHHLERSRSQRILWLLEELEFPYELRFYPRLSTMGGPPELRALHPLGKSPMIEDDGMVIAESGAIIEHLVDKAAGRLGAPADAGGKRHYRYFMHYAEASLMAVLVTMLILGRTSEEAGRGYLPMIGNHLDFVEAELSARPWFAGDAFTAADVMMSFPLELAAHRAGGTEGRPRIAAWLDAIHARPAYRAALAKGGPYDYA